MTNDEYRVLPRISNSDLTEFRKTIFPRPADRRPMPNKAFDFGSALHQLVLEPRTIHTLPPNVDLDLCQRLALNSRADPFLAWAVQWSQKEQVQLWQCADTNLLLKSRLDIVYKRSLVVDIKTTSARSFNAFVDSAYQYDYDRQAAFYLDSVRAARFVFVVIQKVKPFAVWHFHATPAFITSGRNKYKTLLGEWKRKEASGQGFTPERWKVSVAES